MKIIVCIDDKFGMMFGGKRQSRDRYLIDNLMSLVDDRRLIISPLSALLFGGRRVEIYKDPLDRAGVGDFVFIEDLALLPYLEKIEQIIIYKWNRTYPRDVLLDLIPEKCGFTLVERLDFVGSSHEKITREVYKK